MARTLIITNADFGENKLDTVTFSDKPCTGISLSSSTLALSQIGGTSVLNAALTPSDTTDSVVWSTSNADVATVASGTVTATGCGTATITATCGEYSATCTVAVTHVATGNDLNYELNVAVNKTSSNDYLSNSALDNYAVGYSASGSGGIIHYDANGKYPYKIPKGATKIEIAGTDFKVKGFWMSSTEYGSGGTRAKAYIVDPNWSSYTANPQTVNIPSRAAGGDYEGMDSLVFAIQYTGGTISEQIMQGLSITFIA